MILSADKRCERCNRLHGFPDGTKVLRGEVIARTVIVCRTRAGKMLCRGCIAKMRQYNAVTAWKRNSARRKFARRMERLRQQGQWKLPLLAEALHPLVPAAVAEKAGL